MKPTAISLFTGVGGFDLGIESAGFKVVVANEIDFKIATTFSKNFNTPIIVDDIKKVSSSNLRDSGGIGNRDVDLIFGGSPCQGFSMAGKRDPSDDKNFLMFEYQRIVLDIYPKFFIFENVSELLHKRNESLLNRFLSGFIDEGYRISPVRILDASRHGVPQTRKRVFIMGYRYDQNCPQYPPESTKKYTLFDAIADIPDLSFYPQSKYQYPYMVYFGTPSEYLKEIHSVFNCSKVLDNSLRLISNARLAKHDLKTVKLFQSYSQGFRESHGRRIKPFLHQPCNTVLTKQRLIHPLYNRFLSPRECARIQSFPDSFVFTNNLEDAQKEVGNAVPPLLGYQLAKQILEVL
ncbi:DNA-cytosine methyltransferase [Nostoc phage N1]|nr:DNA-cytosine methyltransferase [Nostoc phage N1]